MYTYIYCPYSNSFFILHALIHSSIVLKPELKGFGGGFPCNHHHLGWPTGGFVLPISICAKALFPSFPGTLYQAARRIRHLRRTPDMKISLSTSLRCAALMKWRQNLAPLNFETTFKLGVCVCVCSFSGGRKSHGWSSNFLYCICMEWISPTDCILLCPLWSQY